MRQGISLNHSYGDILAVMSSLEGGGGGGADGACAESANPLGANRFSVKTCDRNSNAIKRLANPL